MALSDLINNRCPKCGDINASILASSFPTGPTPTITSRGFIPTPSDLIDAAWTNTSATLRPVVVWQINTGSGWVTDETNNKAPGSTGDTYDPSALSAGHQVRAYIYYTLASTADGVVGSSLTLGNNIVPTKTEVNAALTLDTAMSGNDLPTKAEILAARKTNGTAGSNSNTITLT